MLDPLAAALLAAALAVAFLLSAGLPRPSACARASFQHPSSPQPAGVQVWACLTCGPCKLILSCIDDKVHVDSASARNPCSHSGSRGCHTCFKHHSLVLPQSLLACKLLPADAGYVDRMEETTHAYHRQELVTSCGPLAQRSVVLQMCPGQNIRGVSQAQHI